ncbi:phosphate uptake regulator, PhoU [Vulcanisaeta moutnovskia 768-28]|uniref:Phosphate uptake regulator, PhoU n=1 Tax=Vulcanisaeta moutnovskia (strain 768-28) TaxID=985053 RepID=F0QUG0_VULM7|nr:phosphate uptake regulator PhoU [Vulcanisaeta moutnovskia]ADY01869.1 phosphate uptake regulator, PhoU [Vulcanisaeta moutnovskia 768-28]
MSIVKFEPETRRVQLTGGATLIVSLPKEWTRQVDLKPGDEVLVIPQPDLSLLVVPKKMVKAPLLESSINVTQDLSNIDHLERILLAHYLSGYDIFRLNFDIATLNLKKQVKDIVRRKLTGVEIIEEGRNTLVIQNLVNVPDINIRDILVKLGKTVVGMIDDLRTPMENGDKSIAMDIIERDNEVDKFYWLLNRQLKRVLVSKHALSLSGIQDPRSIIEYAIINKSLERAADHAVKIAREVVNLGDKYVLIMPQELRQRFSELLSKDSMIMSNVGKAMTEKIDAREVNYIIDIVKYEIRTTVDSLDSSLSNYSLTTQAAASARLILDSIYRIAEYASDVGEALLNLAIEQFG